MANDPNANIKDTIAINDLLKEREKIVGNLNVKYTDLSVQQRADLEIVEKRIALEREAQKIRIEAINSLEKETDILKEQVDKEADVNVKKALNLRLIEKQLELEKTIHKENLARAELDPEDIKTHEARVKHLENELKQHKDIVVEKEKQVKSTEKLIAGFKTMESGLNKITGGLSDGIIRLFKWDFFLTNIGNMFSEVVKTNEQLVKTTGKVGLLTGDMATGMAEFGVGYKEMGEAMGELFATTTSFSNLNKDTQKDLAQNAAKMSSLGVASSTTAKNFDLLNKSLKFNASELTGLNDKIARHAIGAGIPPAKMAADFTTVMPRIAASGQKAVDIFIKLEKQSKALGVEVSALVSIAEGFDTFEQAAEHAGRLNAILGGDYLNSVEMLNATEEERIELLRKSFEETGKSFDTMDRFEQKAIANAMGIKDVTEAQKLFGKMSIEDRIAMNAQAASQEELIKSQKAAADSTKQLQLIYNGLLHIIEPLAVGFKELVVWLAENSKWVSVLTGVLAGLFGLAKLTTFIASFASALSTLGVTAKVAAPAVGDGLGNAVGNFGRAAASAIPTILAFGAAIALAGIGIGAAAFGISYLADSFAKLQPAQMLGVVAAIGAIALALYLLAPAILAAGAAGTVGAVGMLAFGAAVLLVGVGIYAITAGMAKLVDSMTALNASGMAGNGLKIMKDSLIDIIDLISEMPNEVEFTAKVNQLQTLGQTIKTVSESSANIAPVKEFVVAAKDYHVAQKESKSAENDSLVQALKSVANQNTGGGKSLPAGTPVILRIENGPDLRAYVWDYKTR